MDYQQALAYLERLGNEVLGMCYSLENIRALLAELGSPEQKFRAVLIAGTNGKGSAAAALASILSAGNYRAALYTSPHLVRIEERIVVSGRQIGPGDLARCCTAVAEATERLLRQGKLSYHPTYFEAITAIAFLYFSEQKVDLAVLEVGIGGRLDATNASDPLCSIITTVSYDHQKYLGDTLDKIAFEKAGIIRPGRPLLSGVEAEEARRVIVERCRQMGAPLLELDRACAIAQLESRDGKYSFALETPRRRYRLRPSLRGRHQVRNMALAVLAAETLFDYGFELSPDEISRGVAETRWPARIEIFPGEPEIILDGAHNVQAIAALKAYLEETGRDYVLLFGAMADKDIRGIAEIIFPGARRVVLTTVSSARAARAEEIAALCLGLRGDFLLAPNPSEGLALARSLCPSGCSLVVAGSFYLAGQVLQLMTKK